MNKNITRTISSSKSGRLLHKTPAAENVPKFSAISSQDGADLLRLSASFGGARASRDAGDVVAPYETSLAFLQDKDHAAKALKLAAQVVLLPLAHNTRTISTLHLTSELIFHNFAMLKQMIVANADEAKIFDSNHLRLPVLYPLVQLELDTATKKFMPRYYDYKLSSSSSPSSSSSSLSPIGATDAELRKGSKVFNEVRTVLEAGLSHMRETLASFSGKNGTLYLALIEGLRLQAKDVAGTSDAYCRVERNGEKAFLAVTKVIEKTTNAAWNEEFLLHDFGPNDTLHLLVMDKNKVMKDLHIGDVSIPISQLHDGKADELYVRLAEHTNTADLLALSQHAKQMSGIYIPPDSTIDDPLSSASKSFPNIHREHSTDTSAHSSSHSHGSISSKYGILHLAIRYLPPFELGATPAVSDVADVFPASRQEAFHLYCLVLYRLVTSNDKYWDCPEHAEFILQELGALFLLYAKTTLHLAILTIASKLVAQSSVEGGLLSDRALDLMVGGIKHCSDYAAAEIFSKDEYDYFYEGWSNIKTAVSAVIANFASVFTPQRRNLGHIKSYERLYVELCESKDPLKVGVEIAHAMDVRYEGERADALARGVAAGVPIFVTMLAFIQSEIDLCQKTYAQHFFQVKILKVVCTSMYSKWKKDWLLYQKSNEAWTDAPAIFTLYNSLKTLNETIEKALPALSVPAPEFELIDVAAMFRPCVPPFTDNLYLKLEEWTAAALKSDNVKNAIVRIEALYDSTNDSSSITNSHNNSDKDDDSKDAAGYDSSGSKVSSSILDLLGAISTSVDFFCNNLVELCDNAAPVFNMANAVSNALTQYARNLVKLAGSGCGDKTLCVYLNNLLKGKECAEEFIDQIHHSIPTDADPHFFKPTKSVTWGKEAGDVLDVLKNDLSDSIEKCQDLILQQMLTTVMPALVEKITFIYDYTNQSKTDRIRPISEYLNNILQTYYVFLHRDNLESVLLKLFQAVLQAIDVFITSSAADGRSNNSKNSSGNMTITSSEQAVLMLELLDFLIEFLNCDNEGIPKEVLVKRSKKVRMNLGFYSESTDTIIGKLTELEKRQSLNQEEQWIKSRCLMVLANRSSRGQDKAAAAFVAKQMQYSQYSYVFEEFDLPDEMVKTEAILSWYACSTSSGIPGHLYVSTHHLIFIATLRLGLADEKQLLPIATIKTLSKSKYARFIDNALKIVFGGGEKVKFINFMPAKRDDCYNLICLQASKIDNILDPAVTVDGLASTSAQSGTDSALPVSAEKLPRLSSVDKKTGWGLTNPLTALINAVSTHSPSTTTTAAATGGGATAGASTVQLPEGVDLAAVRRKFGISEQDKLVYYATCEGGELFLFQHFFCVAAPTTDLLLLKETTTFKMPYERINSVQKSSVMSNQMLNTLGLGPRQGITLTYSQSSPEGKMQLVPMTLKRVSDRDVVMEKLIELWLGHNDMDTYLSPDDMKVAVALKKEFDLAEVEKQLKVYTCSYSIALGGLSITPKHLLFSAAGLTGPTKKKIALKDVQAITPARLVLDTSVEIVANNELMKFNNFSSTRARDNCIRLIRMKAGITAGGDGNADPQLLVEQIKFHNLTKNIPELSSETLSDYFPCSCGPSAGMLYLTTLYAVFFPCKLTMGTTKYFRYDTVVAFNRVLKGFVDDDIEVRLSTGECIVLQDFEDREEVFELIAKRLPDKAKANTDTSSNGAETKRVLEKFNLVGKNPGETYVDNFTSAHNAVQGYLYLTTMHVCWEAVFGLNRIVFPIRSISMVKVAKSSSLEISIDSGETKYAFSFLSGAAVVFSRLRELAKTCNVPTVLWQA